MTAEHEAAPDSETGDADADVWAEIGREFAAAELRSKTDGLQVAVSRLVMAINDDGEVPGEKIEEVYHHLDRLEADLNYYLAPVALGRSFESVERKEIMEALRAQKKE